MSFFGPEFFLKRAKKPVLGFHHSLKLSAFCVHVKTKEAPILFHGRIDVAWQPRLKFFVRSARYR